VKNTCTACHNTNKRQVGPSFADIAKRKYTDERMVQLIYNPEPKNWPEHEHETPKWINGTLNATSAER
jgi:cytochrome c2